MPPPAPVRSPPRVWATGLALLLVVGCGRVGYDRVSLADGPVADRPADPPDVAFEVGSPRDAVAPDGAPPDLGAPDPPPDLRPPDAPAADTPLPVDRAPDRAPDLAPDVAPPPVPPAFSAAASAAGAGDTQLAFAFDAGTGANRYLVVGVALETEIRNVSAVSFGGRALTRLGADTTGACGTFIYGVHNPPTGSQPLVVTLTGTSDIVVTAASFTGVRQTATQDGFWSRAAIEGPISLVVPSAPGDQVVDTVCLDQASASPRAGPGQTERGRQVGSTFEGAMSSEPGAASVTMSWLTGGTTGGWASSAVSLNPAAAMAVRLGQRQVFAWRARHQVGYTNSPGSGPVVSVPKRSAPPPNRL